MSEHGGRCEGDEFCSSRREGVSWECPLTFLDVPPYYSGASTRQRGEGCLHSRRLIHEVN